MTSTSSRPLRLFFDARFTRTGHHDGISRYGAGLLGALKDRADVTAIVCDPEQLEMLPDGIEHVQLNSPLSPQELGIALQLNQLGPDVVFSPMQVMGSAGRRYGLILTLHDTIYYSHPAAPPDLPAAFRAGWWLYHQAYWPQRFVLDRADVVATVSWASRTEILRHRLTRRPVVVIPNAARLPAPAPDKDAPFAAPGAPAPTGHGTGIEPAPPGMHPGASSRDLLYMGSFMPYKDVETLLAALAYLPGYTLHLLSKGDGQRLIHLRALVPDGARVVFHDGVSDEQYVSLLRSSHALVSASLAEGFGLPAVEAMSQGLPVVLTDIPAFAEVGGSAALRFPARNAVALADQIRQLADPERWRQASIAGLEQAGHYSWAASAERLIALADKVRDIRARLAAR